MSHLYLPTEHNDTDLALASAVAEAIDSNELFVAWTYETTASPPAPVVKAFLRPRPEPELRNPFAEALSEIAAAFERADEPRLLPPPAAARRRAPAGARLEVRARRRPAKAARRAGRRPPRGRRAARRRRSVAGAGRSARRRSSARSR